MPRTRRRASCPRRGRSCTSPSRTAPRIDTGVRGGDRISAHYDPMIAKVTTHAASRARGAVPAAPGARPDAHRRDGDQPRLPAGALPRSRLRRRADGHRADRPQAGGADPCRPAGRRGGALRGDGGARPRPGAAALRLPALGLGEPAGRARLRTAQLVARDLRLLGPDHIAVEDGDRSAAFEAVTVGAGRHARPPGRPQPPRPRRAGRQRGLGPPRRPDHRLRGHRPARRRAVGRGRGEPDHRADDRPRPLGAGRGRARGSPRATSSSCSRR